MVDLTGLVSGLFGDDAVTIRECRQCGTTLSDDEAGCPNCDSEEVAEYTLGNR
ncbi:hypothetical protein [Halostella salina]|uniref:hypothetical protein n=1 Tax=Halostella salina TaxID=1547897 RepID=UPI0013CE6277|nr:hypothetical protein [Halostella salina]